MLVLSEHDAARLGIDGAKKRRKATAARNARPGIPRADAGTGDRIAQVMRIAVYGFSPRWDAGLFTFWNPATGVRTSAHDEYAQACIAAERELKP